MKPCQVHSGTQHGDIMTFTRYGAPRLNSGGRGDLHAHFNIKIPRRLTPRQRELMEEFRDDGKPKKKLPEPPVVKAEEGDQESEPIIMEEPEPIVMEEPATEEKATEGTV